MKWGTNRTIRMNERRKGGRKEGNMGGNDKGREKDLNKARPSKTEEYDLTGTERWQTVKRDREVGTVFSKALFQVMISNLSMTDQTITWEQLYIGVTNAYFISTISKPRSFLCLRAKSPREPRRQAFMSNAKLQVHREEKQPTKRTWDAGKIIIMLIIWW